MQLFISEFICGGGCDEIAALSLAAEGWSMLAALLSDALDIPDLNVVTTWNGRLGPFPIRHQRLQTHLASNAVHEKLLYSTLARQSDWTCVIAPEFDDLLASRCEFALQSGGRLLGPTPEAVRLCADKLKLSHHLQSRGITTIPTVSANLGAADWRPGNLPAVIKPRDGAGSQATYLLRTIEEVERLLPALRAEPLLASAVCQPFLAGRSLSVAALLTPSGRVIDVFPVAEQKLSADGRFQYLGGRIPANSVDSSAIEDLVRRTIVSLTGLAGYVGFDIIQPPDAVPALVEINPRLTTSYLGYRRLCRHNLAEYWLAGESCEKLSWAGPSVEFEPACLEFAPFSASMAD